MATPAIPDPGSGRNRLAGATSPYLLQHADNPVHWWPWSDAAFEAARDRGVPVLLSVGYAACHWCHVMAHESFEDDETAAILNAGFVAIKVDREERPDVDAVYMQATQALTGQGGWPMTVFLTATREPFYAGTYFPYEPRHGLPSFRQLLAAISEAWRSRRDEVVASAAEISRHLAPAGDERLAARVTTADLDSAVVSLRRAFDPVNAGFGGAPKFPPSMVLEALLRLGGPDPESDELRMGGQTLSAMARGGIYDQLAGGFARYSVDSAWVVPHFEKMLYDNALLLGVYGHWWRLTGQPLARTVVEGIIEWLVAELRTAQGAFAASLDADSLDAEGRLREGAFYAWTPAELVEALGAADGAWAAETFAVTPDGTFEEGRSTLQLVGDPDPVRLATVRARLRAARERRPRPARDDKVVAAWNGWLLASLVEVGTAMARDEWVDLARTAADLLWRLHWDGRRLRRISRDGVVGEAPGVLEDYAALALGFARLAAADADARWIERALALVAVIEEQFGAGDAYFDTASDAEALVARPRDPTDNATPSGLSATVHALRALGELTGDDALIVRAERAADSAGALVRQAPRFAGWLLADAVTRLRRPAVQVAIAGERGDPRTQDLATLAARLAPAGSVVVAGPPDAPGIALLADRPLVRGRPTAYVCRHFVCRLPVDDIEALAAELQR